MDENEAIFRRILDDEEFKKALLDLYATRIYRQLHDTGPDAATLGDRGGVVVGMSSRTTQIDEVVDRLFAPLSLHFVARSGVPGRLRPPPQAGWR